MSEANKQVMRDMFAALSAGDAEGFLGRMAEVDGTVVEIIEYLDTDLVTTVLGT